LKNEIFILAGIVYKKLIDLNLRFLGSGYYGTFRNQISLIIVILFQEEKL